MLDSSNRNKLEGKQQRRVGGRTSEDTGREGGARKGGEREGGGEGRGGEE